MRNSKGVKMGRKKSIKEKDLLAAIEDSNGFVTTIAARLHCSWHAADNAIKASALALQAIKDEEEKTLDFVEGKAIKKINEGDGAMIRFYLATKGKKRGYTYDEKMEADETAEDNNVNVICDTPDVEPVDPATAEGDE